MFLLDTCCISELTRRRPDEGLEDWFARHGTGLAHLSVVTLGEVQKGVARLPAGQRRESLATWLDIEVRARFAGRILDVTEEIALAWGDLCGESEARGRTLPVLDSLIAATALVHGLAVVTRNGADFERCGIRVVNPWVSRR